MSGDELDQALDDTSDEEFDAQEAVVWVDETGGLPVRRNARAAQEVTSEAGRRIGRGLAGMAAAFGRLPSAAEAAAERLAALAAELTPPGQCICCEAALEDEGAVGAICAWCASGSCEGCNAPPARPIKTLPPL